MFTIIGGDGKEYGPVTTEQIRAWITGGRANLDTKAKAAGSEEWRRLGDFTEFAGPAVPPPISGAAIPPVPVATAPVAAVPVAAVVDPNLADRGRRLGARVIDWIIAWIGMAPGAVILGAEATKIIVAMMQGQQPNLEDLDTAELIRGGIITGIGWLIVLIVQVVLMSMRGQSIGKLLLRIRVVRIADGSTAGFVNAWLMREALLTVISVFLALLPFIGVVLRVAFHVTDWCLIFRNDQRCLHDLMAGTKVVKA